MPLRDKIITLSFIYKRVGGFFASQPVLDKKGHRVNRVAFLYNAGSLR